eukprot:3234236-Prymnesium_polylepis.1
MAPHSLPIAYKSGAIPDMAWWGAAAWAAHTGSRRSSSLPRGNGLPRAPGRTQSSACHAGD